MRCAAPKGVCRLRLSQAATQMVAPGAAPGKGGQMPARSMMDEGAPFPGRGIARCARPIALGGFHPHINLGKPGIV